MLTITLPDGAQRHYENALTVAALAHDISPSLAKIALAGIVNGTQVDTSFIITENSHVGIITDKMPEGLEILRHSTAHLLAHAVKELYPTAQVTIGPVIDNGFYYDFAYERPFTPEDLSKIEAHMKAIVTRALPVTRSLWERDAAVEFFKNHGEHYKAEIIAAIPAEQNISLYQQDNFTDLCRGPHVPNTKHLKVFKLMKVAGAYWRGDSKNAMLTRIYGTAWAKKDEQEAYLHRLAEAEKRDHRRIGKQLSWFHMQDDAPGMVFWHPKGWALWQVVEQYMRGIFRDNGYQEIKTPMVVDRILWEKSGHWENYSDLMFTTQSEKRDYAIKPMNCPCHVQIYNQGIKSYRDLPLRLAEFGSCHRNEFTGALHGLMRVRAFTQDDAHIFCTENQIGAEARDFIQLVFKVYQDFGFKDILVKLSTRPEKRVGSDEVWDRAEQALADALTANGIAYELQPGEGAFYGPKIEFTLKDCLDRLWQCGTLQLDFNLPDRLDAEYIGEDNQRHRPVMLHRAILGSLERFIGILIEHHAGKMPLWLAPNQMTICTITERQNAYATAIKKQLDQAGFRAELDIRNEKVGYKIREHTLAKVPYLLILGDKEAENGQIAVRHGNEDLGVMTIPEFLARMQNAVNARL